MNQNQQSEVLSPAEVAQILRVDPKTVTRWAKTGKLSFMWTPGGHRRYLRSEVESFLRVHRNER
jgi:excisionase family DNA binding protein